MPVPVVVSNTGIIWDQVITYPEPAHSDTLPQNINTGAARALLSVGIGAVGNADWLPVPPLSWAAGGSGSTQMEGSIGGVPMGFPFLRSVSAGAGDRRGCLFTGLRCIGSVNPAATIGPGASYPSGWRVWWLRCLVLWRTVAGGPGQDGGVIVMPHNQNIQGWPTELVGAQNRGGFGLVGDGAGQWIHRSYDRSGVALARYTDVLPAHNINQWNLFEVVITGQQGSGAALIPATMEFWFNGALITTRNWTGTDLELLAGSEYMQVPAMQCDDQGAICTAFEVRRGRYTKSGIEIQG